MKVTTTILLSISAITCAQALVINEILSNPAGDDYGREWIEVYNNSDEVVDLSSLTISIKGGTFLSVTPVSGGVTVAPREYAVIGSTVGGVTKFTQDYPNYTKPLFKSSISLVNTGVTSLEIKLGGQTVDTLASYTAAKEGSSYALVDGSFAVSVPTPGGENEKDSSSDDEATSTPPGDQGGLLQMVPPGSDVVLYLPFEKIVAAGAPSSFSVFSLTHGGSPINNMSYYWSFGDGGSQTGSSTLYRYFYPGRYIAQVEGNNGLVRGVARMVVRVVSPEVNISPVEIGKYGPYIDITNPNAYDLDISDWKLSFDGVPFSFPKNTLLAAGKTRFSGLAMGFASTTVSSSTIIKLLFPNMDEVVRMYQGKEPVSTSLKTAQSVLVSSSATSSVVRKPVVVRTTASATIPYATSSEPKHIVISGSQKDTRIAAFLKSLFFK